MTNILAITEGITTFRQVEEKLGLTLSSDRSFFTEWMNEQPKLTEIEQTRLDQIRSNYLYQVSEGILLEETIKMVILSPVLELGGFIKLLTNLGQKFLSQSKPSATTMKFCEVELMR